MKELSDAQAAYIAGVIDGEGNISITQYIRKDRPSLTYKVRVVVVNTDKRMINWIREATGMGWVVFTKAAHQNKPVWRWGISSNDDIVALLERIKQFLIIKREHAEVALAVRYLINWSKIGRWRLHHIGAVPMPDSTRVQIEHLRLMISSLNQRGTRNHDEILLEVLSGDSK